MFSSCTIKVGHRRIFLFTNQDNPNGGNKELHERAVRRAKDLTELGIDLELFSMNQPGRIFDPSLFYQHIISFDTNDTGLIHYDSASKFEELRARVRRKEFKKRALAKFSLFIGTGIEIGVGLFSLVHETKRSSHVWLDTNTSQPVTPVTKYVCHDTGTLLLPSQILHTYFYGGEKVIFTKEDLASIKTLDSQGLKLMGFKPRSSLKVYHNLKSAGFLYPDEGSVKGSSLAFASLLDRMLALDKLAICRFTPRVHSPPRFVALLPQAEVFDPQEGIQIHPPGFHLIPLPYADDLREIKTEKGITATAAQIVEAKKLIKTMRFEFESPNFENPALQKHYANLQALALDKEVVEEVPDYINPDYEGLEKIADIIGQRVQEFKKAVFSPHYDPTVPIKEKKRKAEDAFSKKEPVSDAQMMLALESNKLGKMTVPQLKEWLSRRDVKLPAKLKKFELVSKVQETLQGSAAPKVLETSKPVGDSTSIENRKESDLEEESEEELQSKKKKMKKSFQTSFKNSHPTNPSEEIEDFTDDEVVVRATKPKCIYGAKCYRKNPDHFKNFEHPPELESRKNRS